MKYIYIASPYTTGNQDKNVRRQIDCSNELMSLGFIPFAPLLYHFQNLIHERTYEEWILFDFAWLSKCDALLRLSGKSKGADREEKEAKRLNIPIFFSMKELEDFFKKVSIKRYEQTQIEILR